MGLHKAYDALYRDRLLEILSWFIVVPWYLRVLCIYWDRLQMVDCVGGYYQEAFQGFWGVNQRYPFSPTILNVVVDSVVRHWVSLVVWGAGGQGGWGREVPHRSDLFYAYDGLVVSTDPDWLKGGFDTLTRLFDRVGLQNNVGKTVRVLCRPWCAVGTKLEAAYERQITG